MSSSDLCTHIYMHLTYSKRGGGVTAMTGLVRLPIAHPDCDGSNIFIFFKNCTLK